MNFARQTTHNIHPTTNSTGGPACLGSCRGRTDFQSMVEHADRGKRWSVRRVARASALAFGGAAKTEPTAHGGAGAERPTIPHEHQRPGVTSGSETAPGNPQAGAGKQLTTQHTKTTGCTGPDRGPVHPRTLFRTGQYLPMSVQLAANASVRMHIHEKPLSRRADQFRAASLVVFWVVDSSRRHSSVSLFQYEALQLHPLENSFVSQPRRETVCVSCWTISSRLATRIPGSDSCMEEERRHARSGRNGRFDPDRICHRTGSAKLAFMIPCLFWIGGVSLKTPLDVSYSLASRTLSPWFALSFPLSSSLSHSGRVEAFCSRLSWRRCAALISIHLQGSGIDSRNAGEINNLQTGRINLCFKTHSEC